MKTITSVLQLISQRLTEKSINFAVGGGLAATLYRKENRTTADVDIAIAFEPGTVSLADLRHLLEELGYSVSVIREAELVGGPAYKIKDKSSEQVLLVGRSKTMPIGLDFILPNLPWVSQAVKRAQNWKIDFGFGFIPCMTVEDVVLAKLTALTHREQRFKDLDDIENIFQGSHPIDLGYLTGEMQRLNLVVPPSLYQKVPEAMAALSKELVRSKRKKKGV